MKKFLTVLSVIFSAHVFAQNVGQVAPDFSVDLLGGGTFGLSNQEGKVVFIFLFGSQCPHCLGNGPNTESGIYQVYRDNPDFVAIGIDTWDRTASAVSSFRNSTGISYPLGLNGSSVSGSYVSTYDRILVVDKDGILRYKGNRNAELSEIALVRPVIDEYLAKESNGGDGGDGGDLVLNTINDEKLTLYPIPAKECLKLAGNKVSKYNHFTIIDLNGKVMKSEYLRNTSEIVEIPIANLEAGVYFIKLLGPTGKTYRKIFIE